MGEYRLARSGVFLTSFVRVKRQCKTCFGTRQKRRKLSLVSDNPNGELFRHLMGKFSLGQSLKSWECVITEQKGRTVRLIGPHLPYAYGRRLPIGNIMSTYLTNLGAMGQDNSRLTSTGQGRGRGGSHNADWVSYWSRNTKVRLVCG